LLPFGHRVNVDFEIGDAQGAIAGLHRRVRRDDHILRRGRWTSRGTASTTSAATATHAKQHLVAVRGEIEFADTLGELFALAGFEVEAIEHGAATAESASSASCRAGLADEDNASATSVEGTQVP